jgi:Flp pilus assembly CpaF family ATPase
LCDDKAADIGRRLDDARKRPDALVSDCHRINVIISPTDA